MATDLKSSIQEEQAKIKFVDTKKIFSELIQSNQYVGELFSINYETARVQIHDNERRNVGGIPSLCFLIATRVNPSIENDFKEEDTSVILLRVMDAAQLPNSAEAERIRVEAAQRISGEIEKHWDSDGAMDTKTRVYLGYAAVQCRIIGIFFLEDDETNPEAPLQIKFGSDISNYYPNRGLKVYKPNAKSLERIVSYVDPKNIQDHWEKYNNRSTVELGHIRYASTNRKYQAIGNVPVSMYPADLLSQKTALFGMTRTGKSNTTKIIAKAIYKLRYPINKEEKALRIGQLVFDPNGEYANENVQDNSNALKNIWQIRCQTEDEEERKKYKDNEVVTYGISNHPNDLDRKLMLLNFYLGENLQIGKEIIDNSFKRDEAKFIENFKQVIFDKPEETDRSAITRYNRKVLAYRALLAKAQFSIPNNLQVSTRGLFANELFEGRPRARDVQERFNGMLNATSDPNNASRYQSASRIFQSASPSLTSLANAFEILYDFMKTAEYQAFDRWYIGQSSSGDNWADQDLLKILEMLYRPNGAKQIGKVSDNHSPSTTSDYAEDIYNDLINGKLVIIDQSIGDPILNKSTADRVMGLVFQKNLERFRNGEVPPEIIVYIEEAHNILPAGSDLDLKDTWVRTAKEGAKLRIGLVYATQEVSSIQRNILKNTANWFIGHLNNTDETKELCKYYDFIDFEPSIRRAQDKGFLRVKTLSNPFVIPVQIKLFDVTEE
ncbi:MAG: DUF87 domain-containing protein [bacterium]|nr:DUF87 domain-containing protein [bacterium]